MNLDSILIALGIAADIARGFAGAKPTAELVAKLVAIAQAANAAHKAATGKDIDPAALGQLPPLPPL
jgi:hypothetical protein